MYMYIGSLNHLQVSVLLEQRAKGRGHVVHHHVRARWQWLRQRHGVSGTGNIRLVSVRIS